MFDVPVAPGTALSMSMPFSVSSKMLTDEILIATSGRSLLSVAVAVIASRTLSPSVNCPKYEWLKSR